MSFQRSTSHHSDRSSPERPGQLEKIPEPVIKPPSMRRLLALNKPEWKQAIFAILGACGFGITQPLFAFTLGSMLSTFYEPDHNKMRIQIQHFSLGFTALAIACFITNVTRDYFFASMGENLTKRVRERMLATVLTFEVGWFDEDQNSSSAICSKLASESTVVSLLPSSSYVSSSRRYCELVLKLSLKLVKFIEKSVKMYSCWSRYFCCHFRTIRPLLQGF